MHISFIKKCLTLSFIGPRNFETYLHISVAEQYPSMIVRIKLLLGINMPEDVVHVFVVFHCSDVSDSFSIP